MRNVTILLVGNKGSGKSTVFDIIRSFRPDAIEVQLAGHLKQVCSEVFEIPLQFFEDQELKEKELDTLAVLTSARAEAIYAGFGIDPTTLETVAVRQHAGRSFTTPRKIAQYVGTEMLRSAKDSIHVDIAVEKAKAGSLTVVTDCRFPNELTGFVDAFPLAERRVLPASVRRSQAEISASKDPHPSEAHVRRIQESCEIKIDNNNTLSDLRRQVQALLVYVGALS